jgi:hypothetical protein
MDAGYISMDVNRTITKIGDPQESLIDKTFANELRQLGDEISETLLNHFPPKGVKSLPGCILMALNVCISIILINEKRWRIFFLLHGKLLAIITGACSSRSQSMNGIDCAGDFFAFCLGLK